MRQLWHGAWLARSVWLIALVSGGGVVHASVTDAAPATKAQPAARGPQGLTLDSIRHLPDWSGVWVLSDDSWTDAFKAMMGGNPNLQLTPAFVAERGKKMAAKTLLSNEYLCMPMGIPSSSALPIGHEYLFTPGRVTAIFENGTVRRIDTSGRPHPSQDELNYSFAGNSIGHWEGSTLVVDTIGIVPTAEFLLTMRVTEKTHLTERIFLKDRDTLQIDTVMIDPNILVAPWSYTRFYKRSTIPPIEYDGSPCANGSRDIIVSGVNTNVDLTPPENKR